MNESTMPRPTIPSSSVKVGAMSNRQLYWAVGGGILLALMAGVGLKLMLSSQTGDEAEVATDAVALPNSAVATFQEPFLSAAPTLRLANPGLLRSTSSQVRVEAVMAGRPDPFAPLVAAGRGPTQVRPANLPVPPPPTVVTAQPLPVVPVAATQSLPPLPSALPLPSLPAPYVPGSVAQGDATAAVMPPAIPVLQSLVEQVTVSGVVQVADRVSAIVTEPGTTQGRRVSQGDVMAGGRIRVKAIDLSGAEPVVVLTYDGRDYFRTVGSSAMVSSL